MDDNSMGAIEDNNITGTIEDNIMGVIDDCVMGFTEDDNSMGAGDYCSIVAVGSYNNMGTILNDSSAEPTGMPGDSIEHPSNHVPGRSKYRGNFIAYEAFIRREFYAFYYFPFTFDYLILHEGSKCQLAVLNSPRNF